MVALFAVLTLTALAIQTTASRWLPLSALVPDLVLVLAVDLGLRHRRARWFAEVGDADHIGIADRPQDVHIVVAGGAGIHSLFVPTAFSIAPVTRRIAKS